MQASNAHVVVIGSHAVDATPSLMIVFDDKRYLVNCGEGTQRLCGEYKIKLTKLCQVFFTRVDWHCMGGFPGMLLTMADMGGESFGIHGPPGTLPFVASLRYFVRRSELALSVQHWSQSFADSNLTVTPWPLAVPESGPIVEPTIVAVATARGCVAPDPVARVVQVVLGAPAHRKKARGDGSKPAPAQQRKVARRSAAADDDAPEGAQPMERLVPSGASAPVRQVQCLEIKLGDVRGKFQAAKAAALGVPVGPLCGRLAKGQAVDLPDGRRVLPDECVDPTVVGATMVVLECPDASFAPALYANAGVRAALARAAVVYHFVHAAVCCSDAYAQWVRQYAAADAHHVLINECCAQAPVFRASAHVQSALASVASVFREARSDGRVVPCPAWARAASCGDAFVLAPARRRGPEVRPLPACKALVPAALPHSVPAWIADATEVGFLGTGASRPSKYRNVTSQYVRMGGGRGLVLLDCGEGTAGQLMRLHGAAVVEQLRAVFVSHMHADHHLGLLRLLLLCTHPVVVMAPLPLLHWAREAMEWHAPPAHGWQHVQWVDCTRIPHAVVASLGLLSIASVAVDHCSLAYGLVMEWRAGEDAPFKLVYSGDTRPCAALEAAGANADLLIHEATFEDAMADDAEAKKHSTIGEAVASAVRMGARHVVLTHFSQRYPKTVTDAGPHPVALAWDLMCFQRHHLPLLPHLSGLARNVFPDDEDDDDDEGDHGDDDNHKH